MGTQNMQNISRQFFLGGEVIFMDEYYYMMYENKIKIKWMKFYNFV